MASLTISLLWLACVIYSTQGRRSHNMQHTERHLPAQSSTSSIEVYRSINGAADSRNVLSKLESPSALANMLLRLNPRPSSRPSPVSMPHSESQLRSGAQLSPIIRLAAITSSFIAPAYAFAEEAKSQAADDMLAQSYGIFEYLINHLSDLTTLLVLGFTFKYFVTKPKIEKMDLPPKLAKALGISKGPKEFLEIQRMNEKLESFDFSFQKAVVSEEAALRQNRKVSFNRRFGAELASFNLDADVLTRIEEAEKIYRKADKKLRTELAKKLSELRATAMGANISEGGMNMMAGFTKGNLQKKVADIQAKRFQVETDFLSFVSKSLSSEQASRIIAILKSDEIKRDDAAANSLDAIASLENIAASARTNSKHVWVLKFNGDVLASQVASLRQEITALLRVANASRGDEALLVLNTGGGTVTGYGLAAAQLMRIKNAGIPLTISVEQVAASGGYMMACVADKLFASPFAVLGSVGVITEQANVYDRLQKEGVTFSTITAGKYKRTLTPTKKIDEQDKRKLKDDLERVLVLFKDFVAKSRPSLDIDKIATGETWFGPDALANGLVDGLLTVDEILTDLVSHGAEVYSIVYQEKPASPLASLVGAPGMNSLSATPTWRELALALLSRIRGPTTDTMIPSAINAALQESILEASEAEAYEDEFMLKRPMGEVDPLLRWRGEKDPADLWRGL